MQIPGSIPFLSVEAQKALAGWDTLPEEVQKKLFPALKAGHELSQLLFAQATKDNPQFPSGVVRHITTAELNSLSSTTQS